MEEEKKDIQIENNANAETTVSNPVVEAPVIDLTPEPEPVLENPVEVQAAPTVEVEAQVSEPVVVPEVPVEAPVPEVAPVVEAAPETPVPVAPEPVAQMPAEAPVEPTVEAPVSAPAQVTPAPVTPVLAEAPVGVSVPEPVVETPAAPINPVNAPVAPTVSEEAPMPIENSAQMPLPEEPKKKKPIIPIICAAVVLLLVGGFGVFKFVLNNPYENAITSVFKAFHNNNKLYDGVYKTVVNLKLEALGENEPDESLEYSMALDMTADAKNNKYLVNLGMTEGEESINYNAFVNENKIYFKVPTEEGSTKTYYMDFGKLLDEEDVKIEIKEEDLNYVVDKVEEALKEAFKDEKRKSETKKVTVKGKEQKLKNNYYIINDDNATRIEKNFIKVINTDEFAKRLAKMTGSEEKDIKEALNEMEKMLTEETDKAVDSGAGKTNIKFGVYTRGLLDSYAGFNIAIDDTELISYVEDENYFILTFGESKSIYGEVEAYLDEEKINAKITSEGKTVLTANSHKESDKNVFEINIADQLKITGDFKIEENAKMPEFDTKDAVDIDKMTDEEKEEFYELYYSMLGIDPSGYEDYSEPSFEEDVIDAYKQAQTQFINDSLTSAEDRTYGSECDNELEDVSLMYDYLIKFDKNGNIVKFYFADMFSSKQIKYDGDGLVIDNLDDYLDDYDMSVSYACE